MRYYKCSPLSYLMKGTIMKQTQVSISIRALFSAVVKGEAASGTLQSVFADRIKAGTTSRDDKDGMKAVRATLRKECGLPDKAPVRIITESKQAPKEARENRFDVLFHRAGNLAYPKAKPGPVDKKGNAQEAEKAKGAEKAQGITHRTQAYALVLQDLAACKTAGALANSEITALAKLLPKLHDWAMLEK